MPHEPRKPRPAQAVLAYKTKRGIINRTIQATPDNIVGRLTIASLDGEMLKQELLGPPEIVVVMGGKSATAVVARRPAFRLAFALDGGGADAGGVVEPIISNKLSRWPPGVTGRIRCQQTGGRSVALCTNEPDPSRDTFSLDRKVAFMWDFGGTRDIASFPKPEEGGRVQLTQEPHFMSLETLRPGDATVTVTRDNIVRMLTVEVRQDPKGPVPGTPLTKLTSGSKFFSARTDEGGEADPANVCSGRPIDPRRGGRLINLGGETETPGFEDFQVDLDHSLGQKGGFRPWTDDFPNGTLLVPSKSASHITMRGTPLFPSFVKVIKRIAQPGCRFTFCGAPVFLDKIRSEIPGRQLELMNDEPSSANVTPFVLLTWEIN